MAKILPRLVECLLNLHDRGPGFKPKQGQYVALLHLGSMLRPQYSLEGGGVDWLVRCWHSGRVEKNSFF